MEEEVNISWSKHFHDRLMERFGLVLKEEHKKAIEEQIIRGEIFCTLKRTFDRTSNVYHVQIEGHPILVVLQMPCMYVTTVFRRNWFEKKGDTWERKKHFKLKPPRKKAPRNLAMLRAREYKERILEYESDYDY